MAETMTSQNDALLRVNGLRTVFRTAAGTAVAVDGLAYSLQPGETLAVVGESGSGKSVAALSLMGGAGVISSRRRNIDFSFVLIRNLHHRVGWVRR